MNEMLEQLKIDPEFEKVIPPISLAEFVQLEENILIEGQILTPIAVWNGIANIKKPSRTNILIQS